MIWLTWPFKHDRTELVSAVKINESINIGHYQLGRSHAVSKKKKKKTLLDKQETLLYVTHEQTSIKILAPVSQPDSLWVLCSSNLVIVFFLIIQG